MDKQYGIKYLFIDDSDFIDDHCDATYFHEMINLVRILRK